MLIASPTPKAELRAAALAKRAVLDDASRAAAAETVAERAAALVPSCRIVALYAPIRGELDTEPLARVLLEQGHRLALPVVGERAAALTFRAWMPGDPLLPGFGRIPQPLPDAATVIPDFLFVPLAAFDRAGHRLGYGAGFYDRTLAALRAEGPVPAYGLAFAVQEMPALPAEPHDIALDGIVTETALVSRAER